MDTKTKKRAKAIEKVFSDEKFINSCISKLESFNKYDLESFFGDVFSYYLCTMDRNISYTKEEITGKLYELTIQGHDIFDVEEKVNEIIDQRYYFQAYNGGCEQTYRKNGLDDISDLPSEVKDAMELLENELGKTIAETGGSHQKGDKTSHNSFITSDPSMLMHYALNYAPERLWAGPLNETGNYIEPLKTPMKIGETKEEYMLRIIENKLDKLGEKTEDEKEKIRNAGKLIAKVYGTKRPRIAIIPESEISNYEVGTSVDNTWGTIGEVGKELNGNWTYTLISDPNFCCEHGMVLHQKVTPQKFVSVSIPDTYELLQMYAIQRGANKGDLINPYNGKVVEKYQEKGLIQTDKTKNIFLSILEKLRPKKTNNIQNDIQQYEDLRKSLFRWNRCNAQM